MKKWSIGISIILSLFCTCAVHYRENKTRVVQAEISTEVLRFHVRANSNEEQDQKVKMAVKAAVVEYLQPILAYAADLEEARLLVENHFPKIKSIIHEELNESECFYGFDIGIRKEEFPRKTYGDCTFPEGIYEAVIISLGSGKGDNWWCMLYPGLCFLNDTYSIVADDKKEELKGILTDDAYDWITDSDHVQIKFRMDWLNEIFDPLLDCK